MWSFPRAVWDAVLMGKAVSGGCCHQKQNASVCHPTISTQPRVLRLYLHIYPLKGVSGILHCWFLKGRKRNQKTLLGADPLRDSKFPGGMWSWTEGIRCSWSQESSGLTRGWVGHGGGKEGFLAGTQGQAAGDLQHCSICPDFLDVEQSLRCAEGGQGLGWWNTNHTCEMGIAARNHCFSAAGYTGTYILLGWGMQEPPAFYMISVCSTQGNWCYFSQRQALESVAGWCGCQSSATWALFVRSEKHGWCLGHFQSKHQQQSLQF